MLVGHAISGYKHPSGGIHIHLSGSKATTVVDHENWYNDRAAKLATFLKYLTDMTKITFTVTCSYNTNVHFDRYSIAKPKSPVYATKALFVIGPMRDMGFKGENKRNMFDGDSVYINFSYNFVQSFKNPTRFINDDLPNIFNNKILLGNYKAISKPTNLKISKWMRGILGNEKVFCFINPAKYIRSETMKDVNNVIGIVIPGEPGTGEWADIIPIYIYIKQKGGETNKNTYLSKAYSNAQKIQNVDDDLDHILPLINDYTTNVQDLIHWMKLSLSVSLTPISRSSNESLGKQAQSGPGLALGGNKTAPASNKYVKTSRKDQSGRVIYERAAGSKGEYVRRKSKSGTFAYHKV